MKKHVFSIITDVPDLDDFPVDAVFEAGCDDATPTSRDGMTYVDFTRAGESMAEAIASAVRDLEAGLSAGGSGGRIVRVEPDELVSASEAATRAGMSPEAIRQYIEGTRGPGPVGRRRGQGGDDIVARRAGQPVDRIETRQAGFQTAQRLLHRFMNVAADCHHFADRLHGGAQYRLRPP